MFKRLLFGNEESKLGFKTSTTSGIARLYTDPAIPISDTQYWLKYLDCFESASDVFSLLSVSDVRRALIVYPENVATLVKVLVRHLEGLRDDAEFSPLPEPSAATGLAAGFSKNMADWMPAMATGSSKSSSLRGGPSGAASSSSSSAAAISSPRDRTREALNCCRVLSRILPVIMEGDHDSSCNAQADGMSNNQMGSLGTNDFERSLLWSEVDDVESLTGALSSSTALDGSSPDESETQFVISAGDDDDGGDTSTDPLRAPAIIKADANASQLAEKRTEMRTLGERLTSTIVDLLFYSGFTIPWTDEQISQHRPASVSKSRTHYCIWEKGIGSSLDLPGTTRTHESHRIEVLRLLLVLLSKSVYVPAHLQTSTEDFALSHITTSLERSKVLPLLCSLINVSVVRVKNEGWLGGIASLPAGLVKDRLSNSGEQDIRHNTILLSLQVLNVLLSYERPSGEAEQDTSFSTPYLASPRPSLHNSRSFQSMRSVQSLHRTETDGLTNLFRVYLSKLHRQPDFFLLSDGIFTIISQRLSPASILSPTVNASDTSSAGPHIPETLLFLWRLLGHNHKFKTFFLDDSNRAPLLLSHLLYHALNNKDSAARQGLVRLCVFILHDISCETAFAINICKAGSGAKAKITSSQRWGIAVGGGSLLPGAALGAGHQSQASTGADLLIQATYSLIASTKSTLAALYPPLIITITNLSPYFKNLSILSSNRLMALFSSFSNPSFLLADEGNPRLLYYLLEAFNLIVQHSFERNPNFVYALVRNHRQVEKLANFTLRGGIAEMRRLRKKAGVIESSLVGTPRTELTPGDLEKREGEGVEQAGHQADVSVPSIEVETAATAAAPAAAAGATSEKARGKMRRTSISSENTVRGDGQTAISHWQEEEDDEDRLVAGFNEEELYFAASTIGRNGFVPTQPWVTSWQKGLPLDTLQLTLLEMVPKVQDLCSTISTKSDADERVLAFLREQSLNHVLPPAPPIQARVFRWTPQVRIWLLSYLWGLIYVSSSLPFGLFVGSNARLFQLRVQDGGSSSLSRRNDQLGLSNVGNMVFGGLSHVLGLGIQTPSGNQGITTTTSSATTSPSSLQQSLPPIPRAR